MRVSFCSYFIKQFKKIPPELQEQVHKKIAVFEKDHKNPSLKTHKLHGRLKHCWSFSVTHHYRIIFKIKDKEAIFIEMGTHDMYK